MGCGSRCAKYFLCFFNFIFFVAGGAALAVGIWLIADKNSFSSLIGKVDEADILNKTNPDVIQVIAYILIAAGAMTFIVSFLGYFGSMFESRCLLCVYGVLLLLVLILECVVVGLAFGLKGEAKQVVQHFLQSTFKHYSAEPEAVTALWDGIMSQYECCGVNDYKDFNSTWKEASQKMVPESCCKKENGQLQDSQCPQNPNTSNSYFEMGCYKVLEKNLVENAAVVIGVAAGLAFVEILIIVMALYLACCYWRPQHVVTCWCCC